MEKKEMPFFARFLEDQEFPHLKTDVATAISNSGCRSRIRSSSSPTYPLAPTTATFMQTTSCEPETKTGGASASRSSSRFETGF